MGIGMERVLRLGQPTTLSQKTALLCLIYSCVAYALFPRTFIEVVGTYPVARYFFLIPPMVLIGLLIAAFIHSPRLPVTFMKDKLKDRGLGGLMIVAVLILMASAFTTLKHEYSNVFPFHADVFLANLDNAIHFGDPWRHTRLLLPASLEPVLFSLYSQMWFVQVVAVIVYAAFIADRADRERYFLTVVTSVVFLSSAVRILGSSAGPVLYDRILGTERFADLISALKATAGGQNTLELTNYLFESYSSQNLVLGTGISAMPSLHVAFAFFNMLFLRSRSLWAGRLATAYLPVIVFGSVYFGWHYALDGYVSMICVYIIWRSVSRITHPSVQN
jgi:PAP2 superfamily